MGKDLVLLLFETALKPELSRAVSNKRRTRSLTDLSFLSASALCLRFSTMLWSGLIFLHGKNNLSSSSHGLSRIISDGERTSSRRLPDVLFIIVVFGVDSDLVSHKIGGVESDTKLTNHRDISSSREGLHECFGSGLGDGSKVVDHVSLGHADTRV